MKKMDDQKNKYYEEIFKATEKNNRKKFRELFLKLHINDQVELFHLLYPENRKKVESFLEPAEFAELFEWMDSADQTEAYEAFSAEYVANLFYYMKIDNVVSFLSYRDEKERLALLSELNSAERSKVEEMLAYEPETAGSIMTKGFISVYVENTVQQTVNMVRTFAKETEMVYYIYVLDKESRLTGILSLRDMIIHPEDTIVQDVMLTQLTFVRVNDDQEAVARMIQDYDLLAVPVLNDEDVMLGIVTVDDVMDILVEETTEDFNEFSAIRKTKNKMERGEESAWQMARVRMPWIIILVFLGMISASLINSFEETLSQVVVLAAFIPVIMDSAGNVGTQSLAVAVRNISMGGKRTKKEFWENILKELLAGMMIGMTAGIVLSLVAGIFYQNLILAFIIAFSLFITLSLSTVVGAVIPFLINKLNIDPAIASGPFITTINDAMGLMIYFSMATKLLHVL
ncbi:magnesium transporter [Carnobacterium iners]|uniref:Magnesium transporter MgtE n=2 Tax=Carnobacterium iners TaxID=1073423 RepID=A0A1X7NRE2_9LACT|nr:magnesium transporter [Carnobacterium iners]SEL38099.1 magnesium transporter [Carnobacterium iners]SMH40644.1 magnesium transporter [Carnobacterium iners]